MAGAGTVTRITPVDSNGNPLSCDNSGYNFCVITPTQSTSLINITTDEITGGQTLKLTTTPLPDNQSITLQPTELPYAGTVGNWYSNYTLSALEPETRYLVEVTNASARLEVSAWPASANGISCMVETDNSLTAGCQIKADSNGEVKLRVSTANAQPGAVFTANAFPALPLNSEFTSTDTPLRVPDNDASGVQSKIQIENVTSINDISITLLLDHGYSKDVLVTLVSPGGHRITLADHVSQSLNTHTVFTDRASRESTSAEASRYRRSFRPVQPLHPLTELNPNGQWQLHVADDRYSNISSALGGTLVSWGISFNTQVPTGYPEP